MNLRKEMFYLKKMFFRYFFKETLFEIYSYY